IALDYMLHLFLHILDGLVVYEENMKKNMELSYGLYASSRVLVRLMEKGIPRDTAYDMVQRCAMKSWQEGMDFKEALLQNESVRNMLAEEELEEIINPADFLKNINHIYQRVFLKE
ncbi:MAG: adenylosuccinate lyase, partial [Aquificaceae bacterium]|nr:adenylosuccinate lyase [Aquificaceae bacterium]